MRASRTVRNTAAARHHSESSLSARASSYSCPTKTPTGCRPALYRAPQISGRLVTLSWYSWSKVVAVRQSMPGRRLQAGQQDSCAGSLCYRQDQRGGGVGCQIADEEIYAPAAEHLTGGNCSLGRVDQAPVHDLGAKAAQTVGQDRRISHQQFSQPGKLRPVGLQADAEQTEPCRQVWHSGNEIVEVASLVDHVHRPSCHQFRSRVPLTPRARRQPRRASFSGSTALPAQKSRRARAYGAEDRRRSGHPANRTR